MITPTMISNLKTMAFCEPYDKRQTVGESYTIPSEDVRRLRAKLILEETLETINALGFDLFLGDGKAACNLRLEECRPPDLEGIIDGCSDLNYVLTGCLASCGVPDVPHYGEVHRANEDKFPEGKPILNKNGKYLKPEGWHPPDHKMIQDLQLISLKEMVKEQPTKWVTTIPVDNNLERMDRWINGIQFYFVKADTWRQLLRKLVLNGVIHYELGLRLDEISTNWESAVDYAKHYVENKHET